MITHAVLSGTAVEKIENSSMEELIVTDTIPLKQISAKIRSLSVAPIFAEAIRRVEFNESIADFYEMAISKKGVTIKF